jgi:hypothetical protein
MHLHESKLQLTNEQMGHRFKRPIPPNVNTQSQAGRQAGKHTQNTDWDCHIPLKQMANTTFCSSCGNTKTHQTHFLHRI